MEKALSSAAGLAYATLSPGDRWRPGDSGRLFIQNAIQVTQLFPSAVAFPSCRLCTDDGGLLVHCISGWDRTPLFISLLRLSLWAVSTNKHIPVSVAGMGVIAEIWQDGGGDGSGGLFNL